MAWYYGVVAKEQLGACMDASGNFFGFASMESVPALTGGQVKGGVEASGEGLTAVILPMYVAEG